MFKTAKEGTGGEESFFLEEGKFEDEDSPEERAKMCDVVISIRVGIFVLMTRTWEESIKKDDF